MSGTERVRERLPWIVLLIALLISLSTFHPYPYDNVVTRWALTRQMVEHGSLEIDPYAGFTNDRALNDGHYYCDKAVMTSLAAAAPHGLVTILSGITGNDINPAAMRYISERVIGTGSFILLLIFLLRFLRREGQDPLLPMVALGAGSIMLPYSTLLYGHVPAAALLFMSYCFQRSSSYLAADITGALSAAVEFPLALPFFILLIYRGRDYWRARRVIRMMVILFIAMTPQMVHNWMAFGSPFRMGYSLETAEAFQGMGSGFFGFTFPSIRSLYLILLSPERGLLFYMPWTILGFIGFFRQGNPLTVLKRDPLPLLTISYLLLFSAYYMPSGGWAYGPRHLIPVIPLLAVGLSRFIGGSRRRLFISAVLVLPSILMALLGTFGEIHQPVHPVEQPVPLPQFSIGLSMMLRGHHSLWLAGGITVLTLSAASILLLLLAARRSRFTVLGPLTLLAWGLLLLLSDAGGWGSRIDYYRGVLAEHRQEWGLAAEYYTEAGRDPTAPPVVLERAGYCRWRSQNY